MSGSSDEILDSEFVMRRISVNSTWYDPSRGLVANAFVPHRNDTDGLSVSRMASASHFEFLTPLQLAVTGPSKDGYFVAILSVKALRGLGLQLNCDPMPDNPGHALIVSMRSDNRKSDEVVQWTQIMAEQLTIRVEGPFVPSNL